MSADLQTTQGLFGGSMMAPIPDPYPVYRRLRDEQPVVPMSIPMGDGVAYLVTRYDDVMTVLKDGTLHSSRSNAKGIGLVMGRTILEMDGKEHTRHRNIVAPFFSPNALRGDMHRVITGMAHELIDGFAGDGRADLVSQFSFTFPLRVVARIIGIPIADYEQFHRWAMDLLGIADAPFKAIAAAQSIVDYLTPVLAERKANPTNDLLSRLAHAEVEGQRLTDEEVLSFLRLLLPAGAETTYRLIGSTLFALLTHPEHLAAVRADRAFLEPVIEETLRWESPVQYVSREAAAPTTLSGVEVPEGMLISVAIGSANRDERRFPDPDRFDPARNNDDHVAFGFGRHFCAGSNLARLEARIAVDALLDRLPNLRLEPGTDARVVGLAFRSPNGLPVRFDAGG
jgi:cytochrome P450